MQSLQYTHNRFLQFILVASSLQLSPNAVPDLTAGDRQERRGRCLSIQNWSTVKLYISKIHIVLRKALFMTQEINSSLNERMNGRYRFTILRNIVVFKDKKQILHSYETHCF